MLLNRIKYLTACPLALTIYLNLWSQPKIYFATLKRVQLSDDHHPEISLGREQLHTNDTLESGDIHVHRPILNRSIAENTSLEVERSVGVVKETEQTQTQANSSDPRWDLSPVTLGKPVNDGTTSILLSQTNSSMTKQINASLDLDGNIHSIIHNLSLTTAKQPIPNDAPTNFSACILTMDDNKGLPEFIAYHFEVLPLRRLIVAVDPYASTSPQPILEAWEKLAGLEVTLWNDTDYMYEGDKPHQRGVTHWNATEEERRMGHHWRHPTFFEKCAIQLRNERREWVLLVDTDEFLTFNYYDKDPPRRKPKDLIEFGNPLLFMNEHNITLPKIGEQTVAGLLIDLYPFLRRKAQERCQVLPRSTTGSMELPPGHPTDAPEGFDIQEFKTLRYRMHQNVQNLWPGKSILNVRLWKGPHLQGVHRALSGCYEGQASNPDPTKSIFRVHHYTGSLEDYMSRPGDVRRSPAGFYGKNNFTWYGPMDDMVPWLRSFVQRVGHERAHFLTIGLKNWAKQSDLISFQRKHPGWMPDSWKDSSSKD